MLRKSDGITISEIDPRLSASSGFNPAGMLKGNFLQRAMTPADMDRVIGEFVAAARLSRDAGFDAVELHMGHGYLLNQFISPLNNRRRDEYGGSALKRVRFPARVLRAVKEAVGDTTAVLAKMNVADGTRRGLNGVLRLHRHNRRCFAQ